MDQIPVRDARSVSRRHSWQQSPAWSACIRWERGQKNLTAARGNDTLRILPPQPWLKRLLFFRSSVLLEKFLS